MYGKCTHARRKCVRARHVHVQYMYTKLDTWLPGHGASPFVMERKQADEFGGLESVTGVSLNLSGTVGDGAETTVTSQLHLQSGDGPIIVVGDAVDVEVSGCHMTAK